jgi:uncharacterized membrane protein SpoIIM required for sporulation
VDIDVFVTTHRPEWRRLETLLRRGRRLTGAEVDELVALYQRTATHLSVVQSATPDPALVNGLSSLVARARAAVAGPRNSGWRDLALFFTERFPAAVYRARFWWLPTACAFLVVSTVLAWWVAVTPQVRSTIAAPSVIQALTQPGGGYETYYSSGPAASFAAKVWTNNALVTGGSLLVGVFLGIPVLVMLWQNALNLAVGAGLMASADRLGVFLGLVTPHGLLELTAVFIAAGVGLRLGWTVVNPGPRSRGAALAAAGRTTVAIALGLTCVLLVSGMIEAFVTPSGLPTWARVGIGAVVEALFLAYVWVLGARAERRGITGDLDVSENAHTLPVAG